MAERYRSVGAAAGAVSRWMTVLGLVLSLEPSECSPTCNYGSKDVMRITMHFHN
jgi:hypothetical protein